MRAAVGVTDECARLDGVSGFVAMQSEMVGKVLLEGALSSAFWEKPNLARCLKATHCHSLLLGWSVRREPGEPGSGRTT